MERVDNLHAHIFSAAGADLGIVDEIWDWNYTEVLDGAGEWHLECWATLANDTLLAEGRRLDLYGTLEEIEQALSSGPISGIEPTMNLGGSTFYVTGRDRISELATRIIPELNISERGWARMVAPDTVVRGRVRWLSMESDCEDYDRDRPKMYDNAAGDPTLPDLTTFESCKLMQPKWSDPCQSLLYEYLYVGFDTRFDRAYLIFETPNTSETGALQGQYFAEEGGWTGLASLVDGTKSGSYTFAQGGEITWTMPEDWERVTPTQAAGNWFWIRFYKLGVTATDEIEIRDVRIYTDVPTTNALNLIMAYAPATWIQAGYAATDEPAYDLISGLTVLAALRRLQEQISGHFRAELNYGMMEVQWFTSFSPSGIIASGLEQPDETYVRLTKLVPKTDMTEFVTRVYPRTENAVLADTSREMSAPYELNLADGFIRNTGAETTYGRRERMIEFEISSAAPDDSFFYHPVLTANALCDMALRWLKQHDTVADFYEASATEFWQVFRPGYTIGLDSEATVQGHKTIDIDTTVNVVSVRSTFDRAGFLSAKLELTTIGGRRAMTDASIIADLIARQQRSGSVKAIWGETRSLRGAISRIEVPPPPPPGAGFYDAYVCVRDVKEQNLDGGGFTSGAWRTRDINDEQADAAGICSINANQITLAAGTYRCLIACPVYNVGRHQPRLQNVTGATTLLVGTSQYSWSGSMTGIRAFIVGRFTVAASQALEIQHRCETTCAGDGFGSHAGYQDEVYTIAEFWREG